jgi:RNA polymerase sigma factor (sigma-70 family)
MSAMANADVLFAQHRDGVFRYLCRAVGQPDAARDLTQEVFLRVSRSPVPDAEPPALRAWVFKIARNLAINHARDRQRRPEAVEAADRSGPATQELAAALRQALERLPGIERDVFLMRETAGLSYDEIAAACEITSDAVRSRLQRARMHLRETLGDSLSARGAQGVRLTTPR